MDKIVHDAPIVTSLVQTLISSHSRIASLFSSHSATDSTLSKNDPSFVYTTTPSSGISSGSPKNYLITLDTLFQRSVSQQLMSTPSSLAAGSHALLSSSSPSQVSCLQRDSYSLEFVICDFVLNSL